MPSPRVLLLADLPATFTALIRHASRRLGGDPVRVVARSGRTTFRWESERLDLLLGLIGAEGFADIEGLLASESIPHPLGAVLVVGACASLSPSQGSVGDVLVPGLGLSGDPTQKRNAHALCSPSVLRAAQGVAFGSDDAPGAHLALSGAESRVRFGDILLAHDHLAGLVAAAELDQSSPLSYVAPTGMRRLAEDLSHSGMSFGFVLAVTDVADRAKNDPSMAIDRAAGVALAIAQSVETSDDDIRVLDRAASLLPSVTIPAGSFLTRLHRAGQNPLIAPPVYGKRPAEALLHLASSPEVAISRALNPAFMGGNLSISADFLSSEQLTEFEVERALRVVDMTTPTSRLEGLIHRTSDDRGIVLHPRWDGRLRAAGFDGLLYADVHSVRTGSDAIALFESGIEALRVNSVSTIDARNPYIQNILAGLGVRVSP